MTQILFFKLVSILFAIGSAYGYFMAAKIDLPDSPHKDSIVSAKPFEVLFDNLKKANSLSSKGAILLALSILSQIIVLILETIKV